MITLGIAYQREFAAVNCTYLMALEIPNGSNEGPTYDDLCPIHSDTCSSVSRFSSIARWVERRDEVASTQLENNYNLYMLIENISMSCIIT